MFIRILQYPGVSGTKVPRGKPGIFNKRENPLPRKNINENSPHSRIISPPSLHARKDLWDEGSSLG